MAKKRTKKKTTKKRTSAHSKQENVKMNVEIIGLIIISILLAVLIYTKSGMLGEQLSPLLGGVLGFIKYIIPVGTFAIAIYMVQEDKEYFTSKMIQYGVLLLMIATLASTFQVMKGNITVENTEFSSIMDQAYYLGEKDIGGGMVGTAIAAVIIGLIGNVGTIILCIGIAAILLVFMFGIEPAEIMANILQNMAEKREEKRALRREEMEEVEESPEKPYDGISKRETKRERLIREKEEALRAAAQVDEQLILNLEEEPKEKKKKGEILAFAKHKEEPEQAPDYIENNLFKKEQEKKEEKVKEVLQLEHAMTVEDENYEFPPLQLLQEGEKKANKGGKKAVTDTASKLQKTLYSFGVSAKVENVSVGPAITRYELKPAEGVRVSKIANLADDIALNLAAETIRIEAPIPGKQAVGIEVPNKENEMVHLRDIIDSDAFREKESKLAFAVGKDVAGEVLVSDIAKMPHVLIAGSTGSGKSVCINTLISSIIYKAKPSEVKLVMVDPKVVELSVYNGIPHLLIPVVTDPKKAAGALAWAVQEMENRYNVFAQKGVRDLKGYNKAIEEEGGMLPQIVIIIDELADLMMVAPKDVEDAICRLAQKARAAGMHLVIATQRPSVDVITGIIKANIPSRIAFAVSSQIDSRTILDMAGAEKLLGKGDMLFYPSGSAKPVRVQGAFVSDKEVEKIVGFLKANGEVTYDDTIIDSIESSTSTDAEMKNLEEDDGTDPFLEEAIEVVIDTRQASTSFIQRRFKVGYARAGRIIDQMEERGIISGYQGSKPREVLMSKERWEELKMGAPE